MLFMDGFLFLAGILALTGLSELQEYCGRSFRALFPTRRNCGSLLTATADRQLVFVSPHLSVSPTGTQASQELVPQGQFDRENLEVLTTNEKDYWGVSYLHDPGICTRLRECWCTTDAGTGSGPVH